MAKIVPGNFKLKGTIDGRTHVHSATYGHHTRAPRGTHRKAIPNKILLKNSRRTGFINRVGSVVLAQLKELGEGNRDTSTWFNILRRMKTCESNLETDLLHELEGLELHGKNWLQRFFHSPLSAEITVKGTKIMVRLITRVHPRFSKEAESYRYQLGLIYYTAPNKNCESEVRDSAWIMKDLKVPRLQFNFSNKKGTVCCLLCVRVIAKQGNEVIGSYWGNRVCVLKVFDVKKKKVNSVYSPR